MQLQPVKPSPSPISPLLSPAGWPSCWLTAAMTTLSTYQALRRYEDLRSGFSWDLAFYNQWCWRSPTATAR